MSGSGESRFSDAVPYWLERVGKLRDVVRQELVARQLAAHLPPAPARVLDVGCGQGSQAIRLAAAGYTVTGVDPSVELLDQARAARAVEPADVQERLRFEAGDLSGLSLGGDSWDVVCCHGVVMYLSALPDAVTTVVRLARPGGLVSILSRNQAGIAMRAGMSERWSDAIEGFDAELYTNRVGVVDARADRPESVRAALSASGAETLDWYGVRLFTDHWAADELPPGLDQLLDAEEQAGRRDPYRALAAMTHTVARRTRC